MSLDELTTGQSSRISTVGGQGPFVQRLMALGLLEGAEISLTRKAIGGDPIEIEIMGYRLSLRRDEARQIKVALADE